MTRPVIRSQNASFEHLHPFGTLKGVLLLASRGKGPCLNGVGPAKVRMVAYCYQDGADVAPSEHKVELSIVFVCVSSQI